MVIKLTIPVGYTKIKIDGIYRLTMKTESDNFGKLTIQGFMDRLKNKGIELVINEPTYTEESFYGNKVINDFDVFKQEADVIIANRMSEELEDVKERVYIKDVYSRD